MSFLASLQKLDRRWIFALMGLLVLMPLLFPIGAQAAVFRRRCRCSTTRSISVPNGTTVLMSCDYDPASRPELVPDDADRAAPAVGQGLQGRGHGAVAGWLGTGGPDPARRRRSRPAYQNKKYGVDWVNLGYKAGNEAVMVLMGQGIASAFPIDYSSHPTNDYSVLPIMRNVRDYSSFPLLVNISAGYPGTKEWVQQVQVALPPADGVGLHGGEHARVLPVPPVRPAARAARRHGGRGRVREGAPRAARARPHAAWTRSRWRTSSWRSASCSATWCSAAVAREARA